MSYQDINAKTIDRWIKEGWEWGKAIDHSTYEAVQNGEDTNGTGRLHQMNIPSYIATRAVK